MKADIIAKFDTFFNVYIVTGKTDAGKALLYAYNGKLHKKQTFVTELNNFVTYVLGNELTFEETI
jgi:hypothetical protein